MTPKHLYKSISSFMQVECKANVGVCSYRQICVEISRVFLGSEAEIEAEEHDLLAIQMGHSLQMARANYALEAGHLPSQMSIPPLRRNSTQSDVYPTTEGISPSWMSIPPLRRNSTQSDVYPTTEKEFHLLSRISHNRRNSTQSDVYSSSQKEFHPVGCLFHH